MSRNPLVPQDDDEILAAFADLMREVVPEDQDEVETLLVEAGLDPKQIENEALELVAEARSQTPLDWRNRRNVLDELLSEYELIGSSLPTDRQGLLGVLEHLLSQPALRHTHAHFRHLEPKNLSDDELRSLIQDISFILHKESESSEEPEQ